MCVKHFGVPHDPWSWVRAPTSAVGHTHSPCARCPPPARRQSSCCAWRTTAWEPADVEASGDNYTVLHCRSNDYRQPAEKQRFWLKNLSTWFWKRSATRLV
jgi:hypothetical protein